MSKTHLAKHETGLQCQERKMAERATEVAKRDEDNLRRQVGLWIAAIVIPDILVHWPT